MIEPAATSETPWTIPSLSTLGVVQLSRRRGIRCFAGDERRGGEDGGKKFLFNQHLASSPYHVVKCGAPRQSAKNWRRRRRHPSPPIVRNKTNINNFTDSGPLLGCVPPLARRTVYFDIRENISIRKQDEINGLFSPPVPTGSARFNVFQTWNFSPR